MQIAVGHKYYLDCILPIINQTYISYKTGQNKHKCTKTNGNIHFEI
uniref:Uncharacterized protein n=1 Tax=Rhizophora mucronata TaxID=61149 RepID=A0A2P2NCD5_RHIMU